MHKLFGMSLVAGLVLTGASAAGKAPPRSSSYPLEFYASKTGNVDRAPMKEAARLPLTVNQTCYGWRYLNHNKASLTPVEETLILPAPANQWNGSDQTAVSGDRRSAVTTVRIDPENMVVTNGWCVAEGDPPGRYRIEVRRNGKLIGRRSFVLVAK